MLGMAFLSGISDTISSNPLAWKRLTAFTGYMNLAHPKTVMIGVGPLSIAEVVAVSRYHAPVALSPDAREAIAASRSVIDDLAHDVRPHYGVSTGFGALATKHIAPDQRVQLQRSLVRSHAASSGAEVDGEVVRGTMLLRLSTMATGRTGVRPVVAETYAALLNAGITPIVGEYGSLGCSGDLAPLAHCALAVMGEGEVRVAGEKLTAAAALADAGIEALVLHEKEGLALINGTDGMLGMLSLAITDLSALLTTADLSAALSVEGLAGTDRVFAEDLHALRPHPGQALSAANMRAVLRDSGTIATHVANGFTRVQDAYSLRCAPQVHGAARDTVEHTRRVAERELMSAIDNPVVTLDGRLESNGNFHGAPVGYALDFLAIIAADVASMSERRTDRFLDSNRNGGLNAFLAADPGVDSGHMIAQYTQAGIVSELKRLAAPASVDSIPTSAMQEDHVSMGWSAGLKLRRSIDGLSRVLAIELLTSARGIEMRGEKPSPVSAAVIATLRERVPAAGPDRYLAPDIAASVDLVQSGAFVAAARTVTDLH